MDQLSGFVFISTVTVSLIAATSLIMYEALRISWRFMLVSERRHRRILYSLAAAFLVHVISIWMYGITYYLLSGYASFGQLVAVDRPQIADAFDIFLCAYFSAATYTSLGFGDVIPTGHMRMLASAEALNGLLLIGWSVTFSFLAMEEFWERPKRDAWHK